MGFVGEPFIHDVFLSYSHGDVEGTGDSKLKQWSQAFARELESEFRAHPQYGREFRLFLDGHHRPGQGVDPLSALTEQLKTDIETSAVLAILMSPHYLGSKWCGDERDWWCEKQQQLGLPADGRIAVARIWPTQGDWPGALNDGRGEPLVGFCFYDKAEAEILPQPFEWPAPGPTSRDPFRRELLRMVGTIGLRLGEIRKRIEEQRRAQAAAAKLKALGGQSIYLHGRADMAGEWERTATTLEQCGLKIWPTEPDPVANDPQTMQQLRRERVQVMSGCDALLLMSMPDGRAVDADLVVVGRHDRDSARAASNQPLPCALLDATGATIATPRRKAAARNLNIEWIDATVDPWTPQVQTWLQTAGAAAL